MRDKKIMGKAAVFLLSLSLVFGILVSCENRMIERILGEEDTGSGDVPDGGGTGGGGTDGGGGTSIPVSIRLNRTGLKLGIGNSYLLQDIIVGQGMVGDIHWESDKPGIASVTNTGRVTAISDGQATITVTDGDKRAACTVEVAPLQQDLAIKLIKKSASTKQDVEAVFNALHKYLQGLRTDAGEENGEEAAAALRLEGFIRLGDFIDLPGLAVTKYGSSGADINLNSSNAGSGEKSTLRIIVAGLNSFNPGAGSNSYKGGVDKAIPHVVMQFLNIPAVRQLDSRRPMAYAGSDMRKYLVKVSSSPEDAEAEGNFTTGLLKAGVPMDTDIIWAPEREITNTDHNTVDTIRDKLWITTELEIWGATIQSNEKWEREDNQAFLEYYRETASMLKYGADGNPAAYWEASPYYGINYAQFCCRVTATGEPNRERGDNVNGVVPAFCVQ